MGSASNRDEFTSKTKARLAKRSGFQCAICRAVTTGPSSESHDAVTNVGVAAHITAASPNGPRYDSSKTPLQRSSIRNGIWLCQTHAKIIDDDCVEWDEPALKNAKISHEAHIKQTLGIPQKNANFNFDSLDYRQVKPITPKEYGFLNVHELNKVYKDVLAPILRECKLTKNSELGVLMCGTLPEGNANNEETPWTVFVDSEWLRWHLEGQSAEYNLDRNVSSDHIYGQIPAWPDSFHIFLEAIVRTDMVFEWWRHSNGYLVLSQKPKVTREKHAA